MAQFWRLMVCIPALLSFGLALSDPNAESIWESLEPSTSLNYTKCYNDLYKCAKLTVPMDWLSPDKNISTDVNLAIVALPATVDEDDGSFGGTVIANPGGPAGSGVDFIVNFGANVQRIVDGDKKYEILSFDPRGVARSTPKADCFQDQLSRTIFDREEIAIGSPTASEDALYLKFARSKAFASRCEISTEDNEHDIRNFMSTSSVARDMVDIIDKLDELRGSPSRKRKDVPRLQYWGISYGTVLGNYFASMFPGRVGRLLLEGVVNVHDYHNGTWLRSLQDTSRIYEYLWDSCYANRGNCTLYRPEDTSPQKIRTRFEDWMSDLKKSPGFFVSDTNVYTITPDDVMNLLFRFGFYQPTAIFSTIANILADMMSGDFTSFFGFVSRPKAGNECPGEDTLDVYSWTNDARAAIICGDAISQTNITFSEFQDYLDELENQAPGIGRHWAHVRMPCLHWRYRPEYRFSGPWRSPEADPSLADGKPAAPILFLSSKLDPSTPLGNAYEMAKLHPGSRVLVQNNAGHGTLSVPGECRDKWVRKYFQTGEVPPKGTLCEPDCLPFQGCGDIGVEPGTDASGASAWIP